MAKAKEISIDDLTGSKDTELVKPKTNNKKKEEQVKKFIKSTKVIVVLTVILTSLAIFSGYKLYEFVYNQGYEAAKSEQTAIEKQVTAKLKLKNSQQ